MADRFCVDKQYSEELAKKQIPNHKVLYLNENKNTKTELFLFALALGVHEGKRTPSKAKEGLILTGSFQNTDMAMAVVNSVAIQELRKNGRDNEINNSDVVYQIAEEYANTGFAKIMELIPNFDVFDEERFELQIMEMLDDEYDQIMQNENNEC